MHKYIEMYSFLGRRFGMGLRDQIRMMNWGASEAFPHSLQMWPQSLGMSSSWSGVPRPISDDIADPDRDIHPANDKATTRPAVPGRPIPRSRMVSRLKIEKVV